MFSIEYFSVYIKNFPIFSVIYDRIYRILRFAFGNMHFLPIVDSTRGIVYNRAKGGKG